MKNIYLFLIIVLSSCNPIVKEFDIPKNDITNKLISDSTLIRKLVLDNDSISGFSEWFQYSHAPDSLVPFFRHSFDSIFWKHNESSFYLIDSISLNNNNIGFLILNRYKNETYGNTLYLEIFNENKELLKTIIVAKSIDSGDGLIGGGTYSKSLLFKNNTLTIYSKQYGFIDLGPKYNEDSIVTSYELNNFTLLKIDTIMSIHQFGKFRTIKKNGKTKTIILK